MARILIIEDDPDLRAMLQDALVEAGHSVDLAEDGRIGLNIHEREPADLIVTDIYMPHKEGLGVLRKLRTQSPSTPVIAMTGRPEQINVLFIAQRLGAVRTLEKPFSSAELIAAIDTVLTSKEKTG